MTAKCTEDNIKKIKNKNMTKVTFKVLKLFFTGKKEFEEAIFNYTCIKEAAFTCEEDTFFCSKKLNES